MYLKSVLTTLLILLIAASNATAQKSTISAKDLQPLAGCWKGKLHYSGTIIRKPYSTEVTLIIRPVGKNGDLELITLYTKDPGEKTVDTITISKKGMMLNNELVKSKRYTEEGNLEIITEVAGFDKEYNSAAIFRQTYVIGKHMHSYKKEMQLSGHKEWMERQDFTFTATACTGKK